MYQESKNMTKRLTKAVALLLLIMCALVGTIVGLTAYVVEQSKETKTDNSGVTTVKGSPGTVTASGAATRQVEIYDAPKMTSDDLDNVRSLTFVDPVDDEVFAYTITGYRKTPKTKSVTFFASRGDTVFVTNNTITCRDGDGKFLLQKTREQEKERTRRHAMRRRQLLITSPLDIGGSPSDDWESSTEGWQTPKTSTSPPGLGDFMGVMVTSKVLGGVAGATFDKFGDKIAQDQLLDFVEKHEKYQAELLEIEKRDATYDCLYNTKEYGVQARVCHDAKCECKPKGEAEIAKYNAWVKENIVDKAKREAAAEAERQKKIRQERLKARVTSEMYFGDYDYSDYTWFKGLDDYEQTKAYKASPLIDRQNGIDIRGWDCTDADGAIPRCVNGVQTEECCVPHSADEALAKRKAQIDKVIAEQEDYASQNTYNDY